MALLSTAAAAAAAAAAATTAASATAIATASATFYYCGYFSTNWCQLVIRCPWLTPKLWQPRMNSKNDSFPSSTAFTWRARPGSLVRLVAEDLGQARVLGLRVQKS